MELLITAAGAVDVLRGLNLVVALGLLALIATRRERAVLARPSDAKAYATVIGLTVAGIGYASAENLWLDSPPGGRAVLFTLVLGAIGWLLLRGRRRRA